MEKQAIDVLTTLGLTLGEAKTYLALVIVGSEEATPLAELAEVPQPRVYSYLDSLVAKNLVTKNEIDGKPNRYDAEDFDVALSILQNDLQQNISAAKQYIEEKRASRETVQPASVSIIQGEQSISNRLKSLANNIENNVLLLNHHYFEDKIDRIFGDLNIQVIKPLTRLKTNPAIQMLFESQLLEKVKHFRIMVMVIDIDFGAITADSVNILAYGEDGSGVEPIMVQITHPVIIAFQTQFLMGFVEDFIEE